MKSQIETYRYSPCVLCTMPYTYSGKNNYAEPVLNKTKHILKSGINMSTFLIKEKAMWVG